MVSKPEIPAWQRAHPQQPTGSRSLDGHAPELSAPAEERPETQESSEKTDSKLAESKDSPQLSDASINAEQQLDRMKAMLEEPAIAAASAVKKRALFESKGMSPTLIDQVLGPTPAPGPAAFEAEDFATFQQSRSQPTPQPQQPIRSEPGPPIITYPEFLIEAHKAPPLITAERLLNTAYLVGGLSALVYGASKYLCAPMSASLNEARHDFARHSQDKIEQLNDRLSKLVPTIPRGRHGDASSEYSDGDLNDSSSIESDPTELFHRDIGVQTSQPPSPRALTAVNPVNLPSAPDVKDPMEVQLTGLEILQSHLNDMVSRSEKLAKANRERQDAADGLHLYLDNLMYAAKSVSTTMWSPLADDKKEKKADDGIEDLKREIRSVKGVLLSTKTFPTAAR